MNNNVFEASRNSIIVKQSNKNIQNSTHKKYTSVDSSNQNLNFYNKNEENNIGIGNLFKDKIISNIKEEKQKSDKIKKKKNKKKHIKSIDYENFPDNLDFFSEKNSKNPKNLIDEKNKIITKIKNATSYISNEKILDKKCVDPLHIYLTPTQKFQNTINENMLFFNKYKKK